MSDTHFEHQIRELLLLQRVAQRIGSILDLDLLLEDIVTDVAQTFGYSRAAVLLVDDPAHISIAAVRGWTVNYHQKGERFRIGEYGIIGHVAASGQTYYAPDVWRDPYYEVSEKLTRSELAIPLESRGELIGVFDVQHTNADAFSPERIRLLEALAGHLAVAIENARMFRRERLETQRLVEELNEARAIQMALLPERAPQIDGFVISGVCLPCRAVGGDWYDFIPLKEGCVGIVVADVAGKGSAAALLMSSTRSLVRMLAVRDVSPALVLNSLNEVLLKDLPAARFVTMVYAVVDPAQRCVTFANAGHPPPLLLDANGSHFLENASGLPLGIFSTEFQQQKVACSPSTRFVAYSDGVLESESPVAEEYGSHRIREHFKASQGSAATLLEDVVQHSGAAFLSDDATVVTIECTG